MEILASSRPDVYNPTLRKDIITEVRDTFKDEEGRQAFADQVKDVTCSSSHATKRVCLLIIDCLNEEIEDQDRALSLARSLVRLMDSSVPVAFTKDRSDLFHQIAKSGEFVPAAVVVGASMNPNYDDWYDLLLQYTVQTFDAESLSIAASFLTRNDSEWVKVSTVLQQKLKSHPEKSLDVLPYWVSLGPASDEWAALLTKHMNGDHRAKAQACIVKWCLSIPESISPLILGLLSLQTTLAPSRQAIYETLDQVGQGVSAVDESVAKQVLDGLIKFSSKETKGEQRLQAASALLEWMLLIDLKAENQVFDTIRGFLIKDGGDMIELMLERVSTEKLGSLFGKLYNSDVEKALTSLIDGKKTADAFLAVFMVMVCSQVTSKDIPGFVSKHLARSSSFIYTSASQSMASMLLPRILSIYTELNPKCEFSDAMFEALATSMVCPTTNGKKYAIGDLISSLEIIVKQKLKSAGKIVEALLHKVNTISIEFEELSNEQISSKEARESDRDPAVKVPRFDGNAVRRSGRLLLRHCDDTMHIIHSLVLMHAGSSLKCDGHQRSALVVNTRIAIESKLLQKGDLSELAELLAQEVLSIGIEQRQPGNSFRLGPALHLACVSLITSLGQIASNYDEEDTADSENQVYEFVSNACTNLATNMAKRLEMLLRKLRSLGEEDVGLYLTPKGTLFNSASAQSKQKIVPKHLTEDQAWEEQMKKELEAKKGSTLAEKREYSSEELDQIRQQDETRERIDDLVLTYSRLMESVRSLSGSDIEIGNKCLPTLSPSIMIAAISGAVVFKSVLQLKTIALEVLKTLCTCVYEIHEIHAPTMAEALLASCYEELSTEGTSSIVVKSLPSPCAAAACVINEMNDFNDSFCQESFSLLLPVLKAALNGPRTPPGCESALKVMSRHFGLLSGDTSSSFIQGLRSDFVISVLELLRHDRSQTFQHPSPFEAICQCYASRSEGIKSTDLNPLIDERGSLGSVNCRKAAMLALKQLAQTTPKMIGTNPLVESRVWVNCFDEDDDVKTHARETWVLAKGGDGTDLGLAAPSPAYAATLLPLLSNADPIVSISSARAYAHALSMRKDTMPRNIEKLCQTYIESFPTKTESSVDQIATPFPVTKVTKPIATSLPKKKIVQKKSALSVAGIGKPKLGKPKKKSSVLTSDILKPKQERTMDEDTLKSQFTSVKSEKKEEEDSPAKCSVRKGVLQVLQSLTKSNVVPEVDEPTLKQVTTFLTSYGLAETNEELQSLARDTLRDIIASFGVSEGSISFLLSHLEQVLNSGKIDKTMLGELDGQKIPEDVTASDMRKQGAVIALGSVALHLKGAESDQKIDSTVDMLLSALETPSEDVQSSVADALTKLMKKGKTPDRVVDLLDKVLSGCLHGTSLAVRRGNAYGIAAIIKGSGIGTLKKFDIIRKLEEACSSGEASSKEGSLFAMELLSDRLGLLFEPYVIHLLPSLLRSFSDSSDHVRSAASHTAGTIMSKLSAHGVKLVMPAVLSSFDDAAWRTKQASISMLGSMSHLAPKQLASALPKVVPKLTEAFSDTHPKVKGSAEEALQEISKVVKNPEISSLSGVLLKALTNPSEYTTKALEALIETEFLHSIDAPSLALIVPIIHRGLRDRGATNKRCGSLIAGNICTMINEAHDFVPYLSMLLPDLQGTLLDPIPDVRSTSAKALGSLSRSLGDDVLPELRPWLLQKLRDAKCSSAERSGAAQGLTEVLIASGSAVIEDYMRNDIFPLHDHPEASTREGVLWTLTFLPPAMGQNFSHLLDLSLPTLIGGLSDDSEVVRDVAMRAARVLIRSHGKVYVDTILPYLETGLTDEDYRIRVSSLTLLGDLLSMIGGTQVIKSEGDTQDDFRRAEKAQAQIALVLGPTTRRRVFSELFLARSDSVHAVRHSALQVWKTIVSITARTLRDILPVLVEKIVSSLASGNDDRILVAGRSLGDLVGKLGDSVLPQIIPVLRQSLSEGDNNTKHGVCVGLNEVLKCSTKEQISKYLSVIVRLVQDAVSDSDNDVRFMAAQSFQSLYELVGSKASEEIVPSLMVALDAEDASSESRLRAINGITGILSVRSRELLSYIIPKLIAKPITRTHALAMAKIASVTGDTLHVHFSSIIGSLIDGLCEVDDCVDDRKEALESMAISICSSVETIGLNPLMSEISSRCSSDKPEIRRESCLMLQKLIVARSEKQDYFEQIPIIIRELVYRLNDDNPDVLKACNSAWTSLSEHVPAEELVKHIEFLRNLIASLVSDARRRKGGVGDGLFLMPGFNTPKGLDPLLPIYQRGILYGSPAIREASAAGLGEVLAITASKYLAGPVIIKMTGPLLRIVGDRNPSEVKVAILRTLGVILEKGGPALRAFVPQFQTTFVKALSDPSRQVRIEAIKAIGLLMPLSTRIDPLIKELVNGCQLSNIQQEGPAAVAIQTATLLALAKVIDQSGTKAKVPATIPSAIECSSNLLYESDSGVREAAAKVLGIACALADGESIVEILKERILNEERGSESFRHGKCCAIRWLLTSKAGELCQPHLPEIRQRLIGYLQDESTMVREAACVAFGPAIARDTDAKKCMRSNEAILAKIIGNSKEELEVHKAVANGLCLALNMIEAKARISFLGKTLDLCLKTALSGAQRVQFAYNNVLWLALDVKAGDEGLDEYSKTAQFDNVRSMKSLHDKVLKRITSIAILED